MVRICRWHAVLLLDHRHEHQDWSGLVRIAFAHSCALMARLESQHLLKKGLGNLFRIVFAELLLESSWKTLLDLAP